MRRVLYIVPLSLAVLITFVSEMPAQVAINQTEGFGEGQELVFTYLQEFYCTHQPFQDLNHNGLLAAVDPQEFQRSICVVGKQPSIDPTGAPVSETEKLWVIVPFFGNDKNPDDAFNPTLGQVLL